ncbi:MAG: NAD-dependent epimerase/dehydratase family protein [Gammaproteobacteria bacterium]|nr:NAD-dependent epimerase/dehydratase family protein [Gammaproteobacteria bacterium]
MNQHNCFFPSLTRIADLEHKPFEIESLAREHWETGDYVQAEVTGVRGQSYVLELNTGRMMEAMPGDKVIGAFGMRAATLVGVGTWEAIENDNCMEALTSAGLFGKSTSVSPLMPKFMSLKYLGHVTRAKTKLNMRDFVQPVQERKLETPVVLLVGTSMSAGKTTTGRVVIHELKRCGYSVVGAKLTGAGRYRDVLSFGDAGADHIFDFVDAGLPSTVCEPDEYHVRLRNLLSRIAAIDVDVLVAEAGASPLEPYNGATAIEEIRDNVRCTILCASDPYAVAGVQAAFDFQPDLVSGPAANTDAAVSLVEKLTGVRALNLMEPSSTPALAELLKEKLSLH